MQKHFVFGDVHGEAAQLEDLISQVKSDHPDAILYSTGDLIDRGPFSKEVIDLCIKHDVKAVLGNHELWLHQALSTGVFDTFALHSCMQGDRTLRSYNISDSKAPLHIAQSTQEIAQSIQERVPPDHRDYILNTPIWRKFQCEGKTYRIIHAGLKDQDVLAFCREGMTGDELIQEVADRKPAVLMWSSPNIKNPDLHDFGDGVQIFGHRPVKEVICEDHWVALDTGCGTCPPYRLSGVLFPDMQVYSSTSILTPINGDGFSSW